MRITRFVTVSVLSLIALAGIVFAQTVEVVTTSQWVAARREIVAVKYIERNETAINMTGTAIAPRATGRATVEYKQGRSKVKLEIDNLGHPQALGAFYTTYLLWAVAPEGQAESLMELPIQDKVRIEATTNFQTFALMITAEPHSRVTLPGPVIVVENTLRPGTEGRIESSRIAYTGDPGTFYVVFSPNSHGSDADYTTPLMILGSRRAVEIAQRANARKFAEPELREAEVKLVALERDWPRSRNPSDLRKNAERNSGLAHDVMRIAEHARSLTVERSAAESLAAERRQADRAIAQSQSDAERARLEAERARNEANRASNNAEFARAEAERARTEAQRAQTAEREATARAANEAAEARARVEQAQSETERAKANEELARGAAERSRLQTAQAERERDAARQTLYLSLSEILETRREARGLVVNLSDVLFDTGQAALKSAAREKLSKLAGILLSYPGSYQIEIEGHTDSVGSEESNLNLSRGRAESVRDYLVQSGIKSERVIAARGFGESTPVADNATAAGRQVNRRVEIVIEDHLDKNAKAGNQ